MSQWEGWPIFYLQGEMRVSKKKRRCENQKGLRTEVGPDFKSNRTEYKRTAQSLPYASILQIGQSPGGLSSPMYLGLGMLSN